MSWYSEIKIWAQSLDEKWNKASAEGLGFPEFATQMMTGHEFHKNFNLEEVIKELLEEKIYPEQTHPHSTFGEPPITLYLSKDQTFYLDLYIWSEAQTSIHQHYFEGAFTVLQGTSLESDYEFHATRSLGTSKIGKLHKKALRKLIPGDLRTIHFLDKLVHRVLHVSKPTVSLVLRTYKKVKVELQYNYDFDVLASDGHPPGDIIGKFRVLEWYLSKGHAPTYQMVEDLIPYARLWTTLGNFTQGHSLLKKLSFLQTDSDLLIGLSRQQLFLRIYAELQSEEDRILFTAFEFNSQTWKTWVEDNFQIPKDEVENKLKSALEKCKTVDESSKKSALLNPLF